MGNDCISSDTDPSLKYKELSFDKETPLIIVTCSDGFTKFSGTSNTQKMLEYLKIITS